jgi:hypothetical protein
LSEREEQKAKARYWPVAPHNTQRNFISTIRNKLIVAQEFAEEGGSLLYQKSSPLHLILPQLIPGHIVSETHI